MNKKGEIFTREIFMNKNKKGEIFFMNKKGEIFTREIFMGGKNAS